MAGHVFISYSRCDELYVDRLAEWLTEAGVPVWLDRQRLEVGDRWAHELRDRIDDCAVLLVVMSPAAEASIYVGNEVQRARDRAKPILPLLLSGEPWFELGTVNYFDARPDRLPERRFLERLRELTTPAADTRVVLPSANSWWRRCGYPEQVADIAPVELSGREAELAELAGWCAGDEPYVWWQAPARAGKTALMSWFSRHPPSGTWVVSFFVTARLAGQSDSTAFTDALLDQLAAITGEPVPPAATAGERHRLRQRLLPVAAKRAVETGRRLVLLVDGLDEDSGSFPGSGLASIAATLPKRPPDGLRVIVAGRPDPPVPADVDGDHPLRTCRVRTLEPSPHAQRIAELAQRELDEVLTVDRAGQRQLAYEIVGLVTAAGGGLSRPDLLELTTEPAFRLDGLLGGVFGRTIAARGSEYLFTHETLQAEAVDRLGPHILAGFEARIHAWADDYRGRQWPEQTPAYLIRGYPRRLAEVGDRDRLVNLAIDSRRHDRMLAATGGDSAAFTEIGLAQNHLLARNPPDLLRLVHLSRHRNELQARNRWIPDELPAVWATLGEVPRAEAMLRAITDGGRYSRGARQLTKAIADAGDFDGAAAFAESLTSVYDRDSTRAQVAQAMAYHGHHDEAVRMASTVESESVRQAALFSLARSLAEVGKPNQAVELAKAAGTREPSHASRRSLAEVMARAGHHEEAKRIADGLDDRPYSDGESLAGIARAMAANGDHEQAEEFVAQIGGPRPRVETLAGLAELAAAAGLTDRAARLAAEADRRAGELDGEVDNFEVQERTAGALAAAAEALARTGESDRARRRLAQAERIAAAIIDPDGLFIRDPILARVAEAMVVFGDYAEAERIVGIIGSPSIRADGLTRIAMIAARSGSPAVAKRLANEAEGIVRPLVDSSQRSAEALAVVRAVAITRAYDRAERIARAGPPSSLISVLSAIVEEAVAAGARDVAEKLAGTLHTLEPGGGGWQPERFVRALCEWGRYDSVELFAESITYPPQRAHLRAIVAEKLADSGHYQRAEHLARLADSEFSQVGALAGVAGAMARRGDHDWAERVARDNPSVPDRTVVLARVVAVTAEQGRWAQAERLAQTISSFDAMSSIAVAAARAGQRALASRLVVTVRHRLEPGERLGRLGQALAEAGDYGLAAYLARVLADTLAHRRTRHLTEWDVQQPFDAAVDAAVLAGGYPTADSIARGTPRSPAAASSLALIGAVRAALQPGFRPTDPDLQRFLSSGRMAKIAVSLARSGRLSDAEKVARAIPDMERDEALSTVGLELAARGQTERGAEIIEAVTETERKAHALAEIARGAGPPAAAHLLGRALAAGPWTTPLPVLAAVYPDVILRLADEFEADEPVR
ncbi:TIR domain-containing protein [Actinoplanes sp. URMC 104]|uniref:TIR domain-containing protein n=1 Tax=Actinoplanes sp. URMC 104 TaxID=3423409 RepID=UPI003F1B0936